MVVQRTIVRSTAAAETSVLARLLARRRIQFITSLLLAAVLPYVVRSLTVPGSASDPPNVNSFIANLSAVALVTWVRHSIASFPGIRSSYLILPSAFATYGFLLVFVLMTRLPYDRGALVAGFLLHVTWNYAIYLIAGRRTWPRITIVPFGDAPSLTKIRNVQWSTIKAPELKRLKSQTLVADFSAKLPPEWERFLADAALAGKIIYQHKLLAESLTGRVELAHLSENSFGSLVPAQGWFYMKSVADFVAAVLVLPIVLPVCAAVAALIAWEGGGPVLFRQKRIGHAGRTFTVYKFRTMRTSAPAASLRAAMTEDDDPRITRIGRFLRRSRLDELPQILNILKFEMSWIGPRPEAEVLSELYTNELAFYRYRHVVKPGISGWAQVNQGHVAEVEQVHRKLQYDFYYIKYFSPWLDLLILFRTAKTILTGFGAR